MFSVIATIVVITYATPIFLLAIMPAMWYYTATQKFFISTSRELMCVVNTGNRVGVLWW